MKIEVLNEAFFPMASGAKLSHNISPQKTVARSPLNRFSRPFCRGLFPYVRIVTGRTDDIAALLELSLISINGKCLGDQIIRYPVCAGFL